MKKHLSQLKASLHYWLGVVLFKSGMAGKHVLIHDFCMAQLQRAADDGMTKAQLLFGQLLAYRGLTDLNKVAGMKYLRSSAQQGSADAQFMLAEALLDESKIETTSLTKSCNGAFEPLNIAEPIALYIKAAKAGHTMAALRLSQFYRQGKYGLECDEQQADYWQSEFYKKGNQV